MLASRLGADFARSATGNYDKHVSPRVRTPRAIHSLPRMTERHADPPWAQHAPAIGGRSG
jgi:hypothetical protein